MGLIKRWRIVADNGKGSLKIRFQAAFAGRNLGSQTHPRGYVRNLA